jgi:hypothetical protein
VRELYTREKYLRIKRNAHELFYDILTFLLGKPRSAGLKKKENRGEGEFRAPNKIILFYNILDKSLIIILFILSSRIFRFFRLSKSRNFFIIIRYYLRKRVIFA